MDCYRINHKSDIKLVPFASRLSFSILDVIMSVYENKQLYHIQSGDVIIITLMKLERFRKTSTVTVH